MLTQERLKELLHYDPETGRFVRIAGVSNLGPKKWIGMRAGGLDANGYRLILVDNRRYRASRLAVLYMTGVDESVTVDHVNRIRDDDRWCNLRVASAEENAQNKTVYKNSTTGYRGVKLVAHLRKFGAAIQLRGKRKWLGVFDTADEAAEVVQLARAMTMPFSEDAALLPVFIGANLPVGFRKQTES